MAAHIAGGGPGDPSPTHNAIASRRTSGWLSNLDTYECRTLLAAESVGRVGWASRSGQVILPVTYIYIDSIIGFRTSADGALSELVRPTPVAFEVDSLDRGHNEGISVLVRGTAQVAEQPGWSTPEWSNLVVPWTGGQRHLSIEISVKEITGCRVRRSPTG